jgi:anionic cell wall polymer biosynthesis LytR-Cps2A-Psr (LCP) family protein
MASLFDKAKKSAPVKKTSAKDKKVRLTVEDPTFFEKVEKLEELQETLKSAKAKADLISDELKDIAKELWADEYEKTKKNPESVMIVQENSTGDTASMMLVPTDKYISINEERAEELKEAYGEDIVEEKTVFSFDSDMVEKYGEVLSMLIENCDEIKESDREKIIKAVTTYSVAKGTIDKFKQYGDVNEMLETVKPVVAIKNVEIIKG